ncbi:hypothetical protein GCM10011579_023160 [Streptomyces albiflavescens]|uniref:Gram-positive cocci surface proteins LPxTG domain-containing protein n=1 Tax=Streptomyces albiflavescens TaxID=1623582 RepID=A0A917XYN7_9ACTN|nr:hypothetical protein [Streptomyces albiflavescens]GGN59098.1 hypothetical protein GCM10011579_023160 [Streptomyces albiflavescens]
MLHTAPGFPTLRKTAGAIGAVALIALGAAPAAADAPGPRLALGEIAPIDGLKPGSSVDVPVTFTNKGTKAVDKIWLSYSVTRGLSQAELPSNCLRYEVSSFDEAPSHSDAVCAFDQTVEPGVVYAPEKSLTLNVLDRALYDRLRVAVATTDTAPGDGASQPVRGTGPAVKLVARPDATPTGTGSDAHPDWDAADVAVTTANTADFQVSGARVKGRVGDTVALAVKFTNAGPGWVLRDAGTPATRVLVKMPAGTTVTKAHGFCDSVGSGSYDCGTSQSWVDEQGGETYTFTLKIDKVVPGAKGSVALAGESRPFDKNKANDTADILLDVTGGGSTGGGGSADGGSTSSTGGSGTSSTGGSSTSSTGGSSTGSAGGSGSTGGSSTASGSSGSASTGGDLANTGSGSTLPIAGAAAAAVVAGTGAVLVVRRRAAQR